MTSANGSFDFLRREWVVGTALRVDRTYFEGQFASGEGVALACKMLEAIDTLRVHYIRWLAGQSGVGAVPTLRH